MTYDELESELFHLMSLPLQRQIKVDFDEDKKIFSLSVPIFLAGKREIPLAVQKYVASLQGKAFRPFSTSYQASLHQIHLMQQIPFVRENQSSLRAQIAAFWELAKQCHTMLCELAAEEKLDLVSQP